MRRGRTRMGDRGRRIHRESQMFSAGKSGSR